MCKFRVISMMMAVAMLFTLSACRGPKESQGDGNGAKSTVASPPASSDGELDTVEGSGIIGETPSGEVGTGDIEVETPPTEQTPETPSDTQTEIQQPQAEPFDTVNETVYATSTVNIRSSWSASSDKLGSLSKANSVVRTGVGTGDATGWSRIEFNGSVAYVSSDYLSTTKPQASKPSGGNQSGGQSSGSQNSADDYIDADSGYESELPPGWVDYTGNGGLEGGVSDGTNGESHSESGWKTDGNTFYNVG